MELSNADNQDSKSKLIWTTFGYAIVEDEKTLNQIINNKKYIKVK